MSAKPYIIQQDSPNLVIVPTETIYEQPPKKIEQISVQNPPSLIKTPDNSVFTKKTGANLHFSGRRINNDVLIDVSKIRKPQASWATNFLQSIGESSSKFGRTYSSAPKLSLTRKEKSQLNSSEKSTSLNITNNNCTPQSVENQPMMDTESSVSKISLNFIKHKHNKTVPQSVHPKVSINSIYTKENSQPNSNTNTYKNLQSKSDTTIKTMQLQVRKEPALPKGYRIPIQSKNNKHMSESIINSKPTGSNKDSEQVNHNAKCQDDQTKYNKFETENIISNSENTESKKSKSVKMDKAETNQDKDSVKRINYINEFHAKKIEELRTNNTTPQIRIKKDMNTSEYDGNINKLKQYKETTHSNTCRETSQFKDDDKEIRQCNTKDKKLPRRFKNPSPPEYHKKISRQYKNDDKEIKQRKTKEIELQRRHKNVYPPDFLSVMNSNKSPKESAPAKHIKVSKEKNKEPTYPTKLKFKKCSEISKSTKLTKSKYTRESQPKNHGNQSELSNLSTNKNYHVNSCRLNAPKAVLSNKEHISKLDINRTTEKYKSEHKKLAQNENNPKDTQMCESNNEHKSSNSISPLRSVVRKIKADHNIDTKKRQYHKESDTDLHENPKSDQELNFGSLKNESKKQFHKDSAEDLRKKLKRKISNNNNQEDQKQDCGNKKNKFATVPNGDRFVPEDNLIISFNAKDENEEGTSQFVRQKMSPKKKLARKKSAGGKKCKKIKLEINIVFDHADTTDEESIKTDEDEANDNNVDNMDLSFLDDFNVDEIVKSLNECTDSSKNVNDAETEGNQINDKEMICHVKAVANSQSIGIRNNYISLDENKTNQHQEMESHTEVSPNRHHEEITIKLDTNKDGITVNDATIMKEGDKNTMQGKNELHVDDNSQNQERQIISSNSIRKSSCEHTVVKTELDVGHISDLYQIKNSSDIEVQISSTENFAKMSTTDNIFHSDIKQVTPQNNMLNNHGHDSELKGPPFTNTNNDIIVVKETNNNDLVTSLIDSKNANKTDKTGVILTQTSETTLVKPDVILIVDSDDEVDIKNNHSPKENCVTALDCRKEYTIEKVINHDTTALDNSEPNLELDTKYNVSVKCNDEPKNQLNKLDNTEDLTIVKNKKDTGAKLDNTLKCIFTEADIKTSTEINDNKTNIRNDMLLELTKPDKEMGNLSETSEVSVKMEIIPSEQLRTSCVASENSIPKALPPVSKLQSTKTNLNCDNKGYSNLSNADEATEKITSNISEELPKSSEESHVEHENTPMNVSKTECNKKENNNFSNATEGKTSGSLVKSKNSTPRGVPPNKRHSVQAQLEVKARVKESPLDSINKNEANEDKSKLEICGSIANNVMVGKLEAKLLSFSGQKYTITKLLRNGKFSKIYTCKDQRLDDFAVKVIEYESESFCPLKKQNMLYKLQKGVPENNLNCIRLIRGFRLDRGVWCFLMEYYPKNLAEVLKEKKQSFHIDEVQNLSRQLVSAVTILRNNNIIHSDIKPSHILINAFNNRIKLCGFDQASYYDGGKMFPNTGTVNYRAPELILGYPAGYEIDVWATALVMYEMAANRMLFPGIFNNDILYKQLCTLGSVPMEMLIGSTYRYKHFKGSAFCKVVSKGKSVIINTIRGNDILNGGLFQAYARDWAQKRPPAARTDDKSKLFALSKLLHHMLAMFPKNRIAIEFVFANPFIYETFDNC